MSTKLTFQVDPCGATLELEHNLLLPDTWLDTAHSPKLTIGSGFVDSSDATKLLCHSGAPGDTAVITLLTASWASNVNDMGDATCDLCQNTPNPQTWTLVSKT